MSGRWLLTWSPEPGAPPVLDFDGPRKPCQTWGSVGAPPVHTRPAILPGPWGCRAPRLPAWWLIIARRPAPDTLPCSRASSLPCGVESTSGGGRPLADKFGGSFCGLLTNPLGAVALKLSKHSQSDGALPGNSGL